MGLNCPTLMIFIKFHKIKKFLIYINHRGNVIYIFNNSQVQLSKFNHMKYKKKKIKSQIIYKSKLNNNKVNIKKIKIIKQRSSR